MSEDQKKAERRAGRGQGKLDRAVSNLERAIRETGRRREVPQLEADLAQLQQDEVALWNTLKSQRVYDVQKETIGIAPENQTSESMRTLGPRIRRPSTPEQSRIRTVLAAAGFVWGSHQADHVVEATLSGPDSFTNLWPLVENIVPNQIINPETGKEINVGLENAGTTGKHYNDASFIGKWFKIIGFKV